MKKLLLLPGGLLAFAIVLGSLWLLGEDNAGGQGIAELAEQRSDVVGQSVHARVISREDLPPDGTRSLFDHLVREQGSLAFPFERLLAQLAAYDRDGRWPNTLLIPDGRSLLKGHANFEQPRIVAAADARPPAGADLQPILRGRLFLGFVEGADEIEVISYNERAGRFEFQLVENYCAGCVPRIVYAKRAICTSCHAGGGPIFPVRPWEETNVQTAISQRLRMSIVDGGADGTYHGAPLHRRLENAQAFDDLTDVGNVIPVTQKIWLDGCGEDGVQCRRTMLRLALLYRLNPAALDRETDLSRALLELQQASWPEQGIALDNGNLNNRDPFKQALYDSSILGRLRNLVWPREELGTENDKLQAFDRLPRLPAEFDPLSRRAPLKIILAHELDGVYGLAQMFATEDLERLEKAAAYDAERLDRAVLALPDEWFGAQPFRRVAMVRALLEALGASAPGYCCLDVADMSPPHLQGEPPLELAADSALHAFERYCFGCHRGNPAARLDFMSGASEKEVLQKIQAQDGIREALDYARYTGTRKEAQLMPPADSWQREALNEALARGEDPLKAMRDQVPSLFDF